MTAVEWLEMQLGSKIADANIRISAPKFFELINQAKEMEKQHIIDACSSTDNTDFWVMYSSYEEYYNKTFKMK